jgi:hypothetical protein
VDRLQARSWWSAAVSRWPLAAGACLLGGCAAAGGYFADRAADLSDVLRWEIGLPALGAHVEATPLLATGLDVWLAYADAGGGGAGTCQNRSPEQAEFWAYSLVFWHARGADTRAELWELDELDHLPRPDAGTITHVHELSWAFDGKPFPETLKPIHWLDLEVDAAAGLGVRLRLSPGQLVDFLCGWAGLDPGGDDN